MSPYTMKPNPASGCGAAAARKLRGASSLIWYSYMRPGSCRVGMQDM
jgi:hypothetical protein